PAAICTAQRAAAHHQCDRAVDRVHRRRRHPGRDRVQLAGDRARDLPGAPAARLPDAAGRVPAADGVGDPLQPDRRPRLLQARSEDPLSLSNESPLMADATADASGLGTMAVSQSSLRTLWHSIWKSAPSLIGLVVLVILILVALLAPVIAPYSPNQMAGHPFT